MKVLLVEHDIGTARDIRDRLIGREDMIVVAIDRGANLLAETTKGRYDVILLSDSLPDVTHHIAMTRLRAAKADTPIIILAHKDDRSDRVKAFNNGADDALRVPSADYTELVARMRAVTRFAGTLLKPISFGRFTLDVNARSLYADNKDVGLSNKEYAFIEALALKNRLMSPTAIMDHIYADKPRPREEILSVFLTRMRKKMLPYTDGRDYILNNHGKGFELNLIGMPHSPARVARNKITIP